MASAVGYLVCDCVVTLDSTENTTGLGRDRSEDDLGPRSGREAQRTDEAKAESSAKVERHRRRADSRVAVGGVDPGPVSTPLPGRVYHWITSHAAYTSRLYETAPWGTNSVL